MPKIQLKENIIIVAEAENGRKFGGYTSLSLPEIYGNTYFTDGKAFIFSLTQ